MTHSNKPKLSETEAKAGRRVKGMTTVLAASTLIAVVLLMGVFVIYVR